MATVVLTAVGTVIGGPTGGQIGGMIGRAVDGAIFKPATREGPRLTELALQTSSYGTQIPKLFGTMRVAGTVVWATDLVETRSKSGGRKGQPSTATYSYSASFAVVLSARPIKAVRRIWADGNLIRGAAEDWKMTTGFRLHLGGEDQSVDPLIASAEGAMAPAHRGIAYAVFENMPLADYGNRIPALTFEVVADETPVSVGAIAETLAPEVDGDVVMTVDGFAAAGASTAAVLEALGGISAAWWEPSGGRLTMHGEARGVVGISDEGVPSRSMEGRATTGISVTHYDPARDYQMGVQRARRLPVEGMGAASERRIEVPAVLSAPAAKAVAERLLLSANAGGQRRTATVGLDAIGIAPGRCVTIAGEAGVWRVTASRLEAMQPTLTLTPLARAPVAVGATSGRVAGAVDTQVGGTILYAAELPPLGETALTAPRLTVLATGEGAAWRRAALLYSMDDGASWIAAGGTGVPAVIGRVDVPAGVVDASVDRAADSVTVTLARDDMMLHDADAAALASGENLAMLGDELMQFAIAEPLGGARWRLRGLARGLRGTEAFVGRGTTGDAFALIEDDSLRSIDLPAAAIDRTIIVMASGPGDAAPVSAIVFMSGISVLPPSPVALKAVRADGVLTVTWTRRSRVGWRWPDGVAPPLAEEREAYVVRLALADGTEETKEVDTPAASFDAPSGSAQITVRQRGIFGLSAAATVSIDG